MVKPKSTKVDMSSDRRDRFFIRPKGSAFKQKSGGPSSFKKRNTSPGEEIQKPNTSTSDDFFLQNSLAGSSSQLNKKVEKKEATEKKPFDKKKWRLQKYSKKYKLEQWEQRRKQVVSREYYKQIKHDKPVFDVKKIYETEEAQDEDDESQSTEQDASRDAKQDTKKGVKKHQTVHERHKQLQQEKEDKKVAALKRKEEIKAANEAYKKKKAEKYKKLSLRTKKGQPVMKHRMEMLLEEIMNTCD